MDALRDFLSWKACAGYLLFSGACLVISFLIYRNEQFAPIVWTGTCETSEPSRDNAYATCDVNGKTLKDTIALKTMYVVLHDHKPLQCKANSQDILYCSAGE